MEKYRILNLTANWAPYTSFDEIKKRYYEREGITYKNVFNEPRDREKNENEMLYISDCTDCSGRPVMLEKFLWALDLLQNEPGWDSCDFIIRTNSSTFINLEVLNKYIDELPKRRCYAGPVVINRWITGTCIVFSRDLVKYLAKIKVGKEKYGYDDVVLGRHYMRRRLIKMRNIPSYDFCDNKIHSISSIRDILATFPLVRVKNNADRMLYDIDIWNKIAEIKGLPVPSQDG
jgi:inosine/xanthosine triphosphate pyrophosphatase family protein